MRGAPASGPARRIILATSVVAPLLVATIGVGIWRYQHAISEKNAALHVRAERLGASAAALTFWRELEAANEYLLTGSPAAYGEVSSLRREFDDATAGLGSDVPAEAALVARARRANNSLVDLFQANKDATRGQGRKQTVLRQLVAREGSVVGPLTSLQGIYAAEATKSLSSARSAASQALAAALIGGLLALVAAIAFAAYRVPRRRQH